MVNVAVLLSAYNGDKFIKEQIESILNQNGVNVKLTQRWRRSGRESEEDYPRIRCERRKSILARRGESRLCEEFLAAVAGGAGGGLLRFCRPGRRMAAR